MDSMTMAQEPASNYPSLQQKYVIEGAMRDSRKTITNGMGSNPWVGSERSTIMRNQAAVNSTGQQNWESGNGAR
jgi:hypothetical protein